MLNKNEARDLAMKHILQWWNINSEDDEPVILDEHTIEKNFGWVFFYSSKKYIETRSIKYALAGNAPLIVNKSDNSIHETGTAFEVEHYISEYEANLLA